MEMRYVGEIKDPIHGFVNFTTLEQKVIDTPILQRLRRIKQLAGAFYTYPGAEHTRFPHSLGVMHLAGLVGQVLFSQEAVEEIDLELIRLAGLLHDVGHGPFSHIFEDVLERRGKTITHEDLTERLIKESVISDILSKEGFDPSVVANISIGRPRNKKERFLSQILTGSFNVDIMDYMKRDSYYTGVEYGSIDIERLVSNLRVYENIIAMDKAALYSLESFYIARYMLFKAVYFHRTVRSAAVMIAKALSLADEYLHFTSFKEIDDFLMLDDRSITEMILRSEIDHQDFKFAQKLLRLLDDRILMKCVFETFLHHDHPFYSKLILKPKFIESVVESIAEYADIDPLLIAVDVSSVPSMPYKPASSKEGKALPVLVSSLDGKKELRSLFNLSPMCSSLRGFVDIARVYALPEVKDRVAQAAKRFFGEAPTSLKVSY
ncbi:phosphohydrolase [Candidatus Bathyarchaeota archaeon ex4484_205]|nr:MAG: phosphohydrolase [Candidatus Bathyarchaeota archaeon ex4484_205]RLG69308.1 MAG: phosphohydrolase [archaeon]